MWQPATLNNGLEAVGLVGGNYGLGWGISDHRGNKEIGHSGSFINGYTANFIRFDEFRLAVIVLCNLNPSNAHLISYNLAGFFVTQLKSIDQLKEDQHADTSFNQKVRVLLDGLGNDNLDTSLVTLSYKQRVNPLTKLLFKSQPDHKTSITFIHSDQIANKNLVRYGWSILKINYYKIKLGNETHYLAIYITSGNKIADIKGY